MRGLVIAGTAVLVLSLMTAPVFGADARTELGQLFVFVAHQAADACCQLPINGQIALGLPHHVLKVDATLAVTASGCSPVEVQILAPIVNSTVLMNPDALGGVVSASALCFSGLCPAITGTYWLDLDAAEAANPGSFIGRPLNIALLGRWLNCDAVDSFTMSAIMIK